ncbi:MAG: cytochrome c maturation protein CcmE [Acidimicrobiales bacterium]
MTGVTTEPPPPPSPPTSEVHRGPAMPPPRRRRRMSWRLLAVFAVLVVALVFLLVEGLGSSLDYFDTVSQAMAHRHSLGTQTFRLEGTVVPDTIHATDVGTNFTICQGSDSVHVANTGSPPSLFNARVPVVVVGHFTSDTSDQFVSNSILIKHSSTYAAQYPDRVKKTTTGPVC